MHRRALNDPFTFDSTHDHLYISSWISSLMITDSPNRILFTSKTMQLRFCKMDFKRACLKKVKGLSIFKGHRHGTGP